MPGENGVAQPLEGDNYTLLLAGLFAEIVRIVRLIYSKRQRHIREDLIEELSGQIILLLLEDNCRRLRTFDCRKSSFSTWLNRVIEHHVSHYLQKQKPDESLDDPVLDKLISPPDQEMKLITEEQRKILWIAIDALPSRQKQLISLVLEEVPNDEIARRMNLKLESVHRSKHEIIPKLQQITKNGGARDVPETAAGKLRKFQKSIKIFSWRVYKISEETQHSASQFSTFSRGGFI